VNWIIGFTLLVLAIGLGFTGYSLPDDPTVGDRRPDRSTRRRSRSRSSVRGSASLAFGGEFPTSAFISRFYVLHIMLLPGW
jgi:ubiquinol-cytochrome c reductase cytochrome b subunit